MPTPIADLVAAKEITAERILLLAVQARMADLNGQQLLLEFSGGNPDYAVEYLSGAAAPGGTAYTTIETALNTYITARITEIETQLTGYGITY